MKHLAHCAGDEVLHQVALTRPGGWWQHACPKRNALQHLAGWSRRTSEPSRDSVKGCDVVMCTLGIQKFPPGDVLQPEIFVSGRLK